VELTASYYSSQKGSTKRAGHSRAKWVPASEIVSYRSGFDLIFYPKFIVSLILSRDFGATK
jgi:hypothetical protein